MGISKEELLELVREFHENDSDRQFVPHSRNIMASGAVLDADDRVALVEAALDLRIAAGADALKFERSFAKYYGLRKAHLTNSGSSANLLAISALTSPKRRFRPSAKPVAVLAGSTDSSHPSRFAPEVTETGPYLAFADDSASRPTAAGQLASLTLE
jgi:CDP-6-deoxy-D-xylo-4-hexulose-3-dehydrase